jgi:hypothetical protein
MDTAPTDGQRRAADARPLYELRTSGLLWLINAAVFHPRGFALAIYTDGPEETDVLGWGLVGAGSQPWVFSTETDEERASIDDAFERAEAFLAEARSAGRDGIPGAPRFGA